MIKEWGWCGIQACGIQNLKKKDGAGGRELLSALILCENAAENISGVIVLDAKIMPLQDTQPVESLTLDSHPLGLSEMNLCYLQIIPSQVFYYSNTAH